MGGQVVDAEGVVEGFVGGAAALGDGDRGEGVAVPRTEGVQQLAQAVRDDGPAEVGERHALYRRLRERQPGIGGGGDPGRVVVVDAESVEAGPGDQVEVTLPHRPVQILAHPVRRQVRVAPEQQRVQEQPVVQRIVGVGGRPVLGGVARGPDGRQVVGDQDVEAAGAESGGGQAVAEELVVGGRQRVQHQRVPRGVDAEGVPEDHVHERLVEGDPGRYTVAEPVSDEIRVLGESESGFPLHPATCVLQRLRQVPVEEGGQRGDAGLQQPVHQPLVEVEPGPVDRAPAGRLHARPGDREPVPVEPQTAHQLHVLGPPMVVVARHPAGVAALHRAGPVAEVVPHRTAAAVLVDRALDLVGGGGHAPAEVGRQVMTVRHSDPSSARAKNASRAHVKES